MNKPPMIVSGTTDTIPARMADMYAFSLNAINTGSRRLFTIPGVFALSVAESILQPTRCADRGARLSSIGRFAQRLAIIINLFERIRDVIHVRPRAEQNTLLNPDR